MITRYSAALDGAQLHDIDNAIYILDIAEAAPHMSLSALDRFGDGQMLISRKRKSLTVKITFEVHEYDTVKRRAIFQKIAGWAENGKFLTTSDRPDQRLRVVADAVPVATSALKWTKAETVSFTAYAVPYWEDDALHVYARSGTSGSVSFTPSGTARVHYMTFTATNNGTANLTEITVNANDTHMTFTGLSIAPGENFSITYDDDGNLLLPVANRTQDSSDDLIAYANTVNTLTFTADQSVTIRFYGRWRYE